MAVYKRANTEIYSYDFRVDGTRYSGSTGTADLEAARQLEADMRKDAMSVSILCRSVLRKAARRLPEGRRTRRGYVYMLRSGYFIKIGHSLDPAERLKAISTSTPNGAELLFTIPGNLRLEHELHAEFAACHYQREWFFLCGKLKRFVEEFEAYAQASKQVAPPETPRNDVLETLSV